MRFLSASRSLGVGCGVSYFSHSRIDVATVAI